MSSEGRKRVLRISAAVAENVHQHASLVNAAAADANIRRKISILELWIESGIPHIPQDSLSSESGSRLLDYYPRTLRQFNLWDGSTNSVLGELGSIRKNAPQTLRKNLAMQETVERLLTALRLRAAEQIRSAKPIRIQTLTRKLEVSEVRRALLEHEMLEQRKNMKELSAELIRLKEANALISEEAHRAIGSMTATIQELRAANSDLTRQLAKVAPIRNAKGGSRE